MLNLRYRINSYVRVIEKAKTILVIYCKVERRDDFGNLLDIVQEVGGSKLFR